VNLISTTDELNRADVYKKAKKYRKELKSLYIAELSKPVETKLSIDLKEESDFDDDLSYKEEAEVKYLLKLSYNIYYLRYFLYLGS
jgi:hypothetical protein